MTQSLGRKLVSRLSTSNPYVVGVAVVIESVMCFEQVHELINLVCSRLIQAVHYSLQIGKAIAPPPVRRTDETSTV